MSLRIHLVSVFGATVLAAGCGGDGGNVGQQQNPASGGQTGNCEVEYASKTATPFSAGMTASSKDPMLPVMSVAVDSDPPMPVVSNRVTWNMTVTDSTGAPVAAGTKVAVKCLMSHSNIPSHGCPATIGVKEMGNGVYKAYPVIFNMPGHWTVTVTVDSTPVPFELCVE